MDFDVEDSKDLVDWGGRFPLADVRILITCSKESVEKLSPEEREEKIAEVNTVLQSRFSQVTFPFHDAYKHLFDAMEITVTSEPW